MLPFIFQSCFTTNMIDGRHLIRIEASAFPRIGITDFEHIKVGWARRCETRQLQGEGDREREILIQHGAILLMPHLCVIITDTRFYVKLDVITSFLLFPLSVITVCFRHSFSVLLFQIIAKSIRDLLTVEEPDWTRSISLPPRSDLGMPPTIKCCWTRQSDQEVPTPTITESHFFNSEGPGFNPCWA